MTKTTDKPKTKKQIKYEESLQTLKNYVVRADSIVFKDDVHIKGHFDPFDIIENHFPELNERTKWVFNKNLVIDGWIETHPFGIEVKGDTKVGGNILIHRAALLLRGNLDVNGYIVTSVADQCGKLPKFNCNGIVKASFVTTNSKVKINGTFHPDTLLIVNDKRTKIEGYDCRYRAEIKRDYWTENCKKEWAKREGGFIWLDYDLILADIKKGKNIFIE